LRSVEAYLVVYDIPVEERFRFYRSFRKLREEFYALNYRATQSVLVTSSELLARHVVVLVRKCGGTAYLTKVTCPGECEYCPLRGVICVKR